MKKLRFFTHGATLRLTVEEDRSYLKVSVLRAFPLSEPNRFLSVRDSENKEVGLIVNPAELDAENRRTHRRGARAALLRAGHHTHRLREGTVRDRGLDDGDQSGPLPIHDAELARDRPAALSRPHNSSTTSMAIATISATSTI